MANKGKIKKERGKINKIVKEKSAWKKHMKKDPKMTIKKQKKKTNNERRRKKNLTN